jgi:hypothetical protein
MDYLSLSTAIKSAGGNFPWLDTIGNQYTSQDEKTGPGVCGEVAYYVEPADGPVKLFGEQLEWHPNLAVATGDYTYTLVGYLVRYNIEARVDFTVRSLPCVTTLDV